jgi:LuxR family maltose regulon positive regulatory protein
VTEMHLYWLGPPAVELDGYPLRLELRKSLALLSYLSLSSQPPTRETLAALFWPEYNQQHALSNLRRNLSSLASSLPPDYLEMDRERVGLRFSDSVQVDVTQFRDTLAQVNEHAHSLELVCPECVTTLEKAIAVYRGDFLEGFNLKDCPDFDDWQFFQREGLRAEYAGALKKLALYYQKAGEWEKGITYARSWLALDRLHEPAQRLLMKLYFLSGQKSAAIRQYEECQRILDEELGQPPQAETLELYQEIRNGYAPEVRRGLDSFLVEAPAVRPVIPLTKTKLFSPRVPRTIIPRPRLVSRLNQCVRRPLTLISASPGFGKTTLLAEWVAQSKDPVAWVSLDRSDNDEYRMVDYILNSVRNVLPDSNEGKEALGLLHAPHPVQVPVILGSLINDLIPTPGHLILVLDDYHNINSQTAHDVVNFLIDHRPLNLHLVISTRSDPPLSLARLRANFQLGDIRTDDLRFTREEEQSFLAQVIGSPLSPQDMEYLDHKIEGWIAGIQMASLALQSNQLSQSSSDVHNFIRAFKGSQRYILDYLSEEILNRQPEQIRTFLLRTSILEKICFQLCDSLLASDHLDEYQQLDQLEPVDSLSNQQILEHLERSNLFLIPLDDEQKWFRYHHLFADLLHARLKQHQPKLEAMLHQRAANWYAQNSYPVEAVKHALEAGDFPLAADYIEDFSVTLLGMNQIVTILDWFKSLPPEMVQSRPLLMIYQAYMLARRGDFDAVENILVKAEKLIDTRLDSSKIDEYKNMILAIRTYIANLSGEAEVAIQVGMGDPSLAEDKYSAGNFLARFQLAFAYYSIGDFDSAEQIWADIARWAQENEDYYHALMAERELANLCQIRGHLHQAQEVFQHAYDWINQKVQEPAMYHGLIKVCQANLLIEQNELEKAHSLIQEDIENTLGIWRTNSLTFGYTVLANLRTAQKDFLRARAAVENALRQVTGRRTYPRSISMVNACQVNLWLAEGNLTEAQKWAQKEFPQIPEELSFGRELDHISLARVLIASKRWEAAMDFLQRLSHEAEAGKRLGRLLKINILQALALGESDRLDEAMRLLINCLKFAQDEGFMRVFLSEGKSMADLLTLSKKQGRWVTGPLKEYIDHLLNAFG